ncbi:MAG TPA: ribonuclease III domain-containing protein [Candidatus Methylomirabilis sp.]|nr:ribonuclease III domain-containing protein [Candidatus Methylomirabilis sp.]
MADPASTLGTHLRHEFQDLDLLGQALTHSSYANEHPGAPDNERLAFLGDAVLALVVAEHLWKTAPGESVGLLTPRRSEIVSGANLARWAGRLGLGALLHLGKGEQSMGGRTKESLLATALEAVVAVVYLEGGLPAATRAIARLALW